MKRLIVAPCILFASICAATPTGNWTEFFRGGDGSLTYINVPSLAVRQGKARVWTLMNFESQQYDASMGSFKSIEQEFLIDCGKRQISPLQVEAFQEPDLAGARTYTFSNMDARAEIFMRDAPPGSMTSALIGRVCR